MPETATFDHYEVLTRDDGSLFELGRGAMGITYKAFDTSLRIPVALKVINATYLNSEVARQRFVREARSAARLRHRHVASVFHLGTEGDTWFYAMEFIDGETLDALIKRQGTLPPMVALSITDQVARALNAATQHGLVHRDIKPANLMLVKEDDELVAKVIDFGLAKTSLASDGEDAATLSMGGFVGTPHFASPEQLEEKEIDVRSDIYSLGITLWYMLAGQAPFAGSMAQVMSQHLSKPPPFEKMTNQAPAVAELLRKMLAKDPTDRYQTPADLRKAIEEAMLHLADTPTVAAPVNRVASSPATVAPVDSEENFATLVEDTSSRAGLASFETNTIIANRYRVIESLGETNTGHVFRAQDTEQNREVRLIVLHAAALADTANLTALEREVEKLGRVRHPNLLGVFAFETVDRGSFLVLEWTNGFSLLELLKARRELDAGEVLNLLKQAASGVDQALINSLGGLEFGLHQTQVHFPQPIEKEKLLKAPVASWPAFELKLYPLGATRDIATSQTWAGGQTMVGGSHGSGGEMGEARPRYLQSLAAVVYELLGGTLSPLVLRGAGGPSMRYTPLSTLSEEGNEVLKRALDPTRSFASAEEFSTALAKLDGLQVRHFDSKAPAPPPAAQSSAPRTPPPVNRPAPSPVPSFVPPVHKKAPIGLIAGVAAAVVIGGGGFFFLHSSKKPADDSTPPTSQHFEDNPDVTPQGHLQEVVDNTPPATPVPVATPVPATPVPATPEPATPSPSVIRQQMMMSEVETARKYEEEGNWEKSLTGWLKLAKSYPESPVGKNHLESLLDLMRQRPNPLTPEEFTKLRPMIAEAAEMGVLSGMMVLADNVRDQEWSTAMNWYTAAAEKGFAPAMTQLGLMYSNGHGITPPDLPKAVNYFQTAVDKKDAAAMTALGECYVAGRGVERDPARGLELLKEAIASDNVRAMNKLGDYYVRGIEGALKPDPSEAFRLFTKASDAGSLEALGNLAVLYLNGTGVTRDLKKGSALAKKGAASGNPFCMSLFAQCLENGAGVDKNLLQAQSWYQKAATAGDRRSIDWCMKHGVPFTSRE